MEKILSMGDIFQDLRLTCEICENCAPKTIGSIQHRINCFISPHIIASSNSSLERTAAHLEYREFHEDFSRIPVADKCSTDGEIVPLD